MDLDPKKILKTLNPRRIWVPVLFGLGIVSYLFISDPDVTIDNFALIFNASLIPILLTLLTFFARVGGYIVRMRTLTNQSLTWMSCFYVIILWEFSSAVTPSVVGGTAVAVFILYKEGLNLGKSLAFVMLTAILDNLYFVLAAPFILFFTQGVIFPESTNIELDLLNFRLRLDVIFAVSYVLIALYTFVMSYALFINPRAFKWLLLKITYIRVFRKWRYGAYERGNEIIWASSLIKGKNLAYWIKIISITIFIWSSRYLMLNFQIDAYADLNIQDHLLIFSRQIILWIIMLFSPTPGSSGTAEFFFPFFFEDFLGEYTLVNNILWRLLSYYPFLILGAIFLPRWIKRVFFGGKGAEQKAETEVA